MKNSTHILLVLVVFHLTGLQTVRAQTKLASILGDGMYFSNLLHHLGQTIGKSNEWRDLKH